MERDREPLPTIPYATIAHKVRQTILLIGDRDERLILREPPVILPDKELITPLRHDKGGVRHCQQIARGQHAIRQEEQQQHACHEDDTGPTAYARRSGF